MRGTAKIALLLLFASLTAEDSLAQRRSNRSRGSVRYSRPDGNVSGTTRRGGTVDSTQRTEGNQRTTDTTVTGRSGESVTGSREVTRDGDTLEIERDAQSSTGASRESSKEIEFDDGRVEQIERESTATGRFGETIERESEVEREGYRAASFEREVETSTGREAEIEGVAGAGYYGRRGVVADVDTKYHGDWDVAAGRGPYGGFVTRLPDGYRPYTYHGRQYYYHGSAYYRPYAWHGASYYFIMPPPYGVYYTTVPLGAVMFTLAATSYYYADHVCYQAINSGGQVGYEVVPAPAGVKTTSLPPQRATITLGNVTYSYYKNTFYRRVVQGGQASYVVVTEPEGLTVLSALPAEFEIVQASSGASYFSYRDTYYLPYTNEARQEVYIVVDAPPPPPKTATTTTASGTSVVERSLSIPSGTELSVRLAKDLSTESATTGQRITGYLDADLTVGEMLAVPKGSTVYGVVTEVEKAGSMSGKAKLVLRLTDIKAGGRVLPLSASQYAATGASASKDTGKKLAGGAGLGATIGAIADGGDGAWKGALVGAGVGAVASAATPGEQLTIASQTVIVFTLENALTVPFAVTVASAE